MPLVATAIGNVCRLQIVEQLYDPRHRRERRRHQRLQHLAAFAHQVFERIVQRVAVDHELKRIDHRPAHHLLAQARIVRLAAAAEHRFAGLLVEVFGVHEQAVEIEDDGASLSCSSIISRCTGRIVDANPAKLVTSVDAEIVMLA